MRTWFITGGTPGGFGMAYARAALDNGDRVLVLRLDVTDQQAVERTVRDVGAHFGVIDAEPRRRGAARPGPRFRAGSRGPGESPEEGCATTVLTLNRYAFPMSVRPPATPIAAQARSNRVLTVRIDSL
ncbi:hypothetical protein ACN27G_16670 [Plantactinospora sp. WMMB334]|uniref:hypothetical protein n=1 Tax=Plantactinospora sp. WMMB334 TaxID=3404119 RepID=UPI003B94C941